MIIESDMIAAPADVPPTTAPSRYRRCITRSTGVPASAAVTRTWSPPLNQMPVAESSPRAAASVAAARRSM
ncbi:MAG TPA: hypothetical protein VL915_00620 [Gemmatimonadales bacterium]|nr:hypothetical protein [Gemmatimonadales bacterium]